MNANKGVVIERVFDAPRDAVYRAWTKPDLIAKWWGPEGFSAPSINVDLRVGGKYVLPCMAQKALNGIRTCTVREFIKKSFPIQNWSSPTIFQMSMEKCWNLPTLGRILIFQKYQR